MLKKLTNNLGLKLLSLLVAVIIWLVVVNIDDPVSTRTYSNVNVEVVNEDTITGEGKVYSILDDSNVINVTVKAKRSVLDSLTASDIHASADMKEIDVSLGLVPIDVYVTKNANKIEEVTSRTRNLKIDMESLETRQFAISGVITGTPAEGFAVGDITINPNVIKVSGPSSQVERVNRVVVRIDVDGMGTKLNLKPLPVLLDSTGNAVPLTALTLSLSAVDVEVNMINSKEVPITVNVIGSPAEGYTHTKTEITPETIKIKGDSSVLADIEEIALPDNLLDISGATQSVEKTVDISEYLPRGVEVLNKDESKVLASAIVEHIEKKTFTVPTSSVKFTNLTMGMHAVFATDKISVEISGLSEAMADMDVSDIIAEVDLSDYTRPGKYSVPVVITVPVGYTAHEGVKADVTITQE